MKESETKTGAPVTRDESARRGESREMQTAPGGGSADQEQIRMRAYELYRERGGKVGDDMADWLRAEREYLERNPSTTTDQAGQQTTASAAPATRG